MRLKVVLVSLVLGHGSVEAAPLIVLRFTQAGQSHVRENTLAGWETVRRGHSLDTHQSRPVTGGNLIRVMIVMMMIMIIIIDLESKN